MTQLCSLCWQKSDLQTSHIIPKFVGKWLKKTSATGFLINPNQASKRLQDLSTTQLLCYDCEQRFSKLETYFANKIFFPFHEKKVKSFEYDKRLELFIISLSWRILITDSMKFKSKYSHLNSLVKQAEINWREFLLGKKQNISPYENHLFFLDYTENTSELPLGFHWYSLRDIDATLVFNSKIVYMYVKFPWMIFITTIHPTTLKGWKGTKVKEWGKLIIPQSSNDSTFWNFFMDRVNIVHNFPKTSKKISTKRFVKSYKKDPQRFLESDTLQTMIKERDLERKQEMKNMPKSVIGLVEVAIIPIIHNPNMTKADNQNMIWQTRRIADILAKLSKEEAITLDRNIRVTIDLSGILQKDKQFTLETNTICITFMVNREATKEYQHFRIKEEIEKLKKQFHVKRFLVVFSMYLGIYGISFESGFLTSGNINNTK